MAAPQHRFVTPGTTGHEKAVDKALKLLERCCQQVDPAVGTSEELQKLIPSGVTALVDLCPPPVLNAQSAVRKQLVEKLQLAKRIGSISLTFLQHSELMPLGSGLLTPLALLCNVSSSAGGATSRYQVLVSTQLARCGLLAQLPALMTAAVQELDAGRLGTPISPDNMPSPPATPTTSSSSGSSSSSRSRPGRGSANSGSSSFSSAAAAASSGSTTTQPEVLLCNHVGALLQLAEYLQGVWPGNLLQSPDVSPVFQPATQLALSTIQYANSRLLQLSEQVELPTTAVYRALHSAIRLCPCMCSLLARHGTRAAGPSMTVLPAASELMAAHSFRQCVLVYIALQAQTQMVAPQHGWLSPAEATHPKRPSSSSSKKGSSRRSGAGGSSTSCAPGSSSSGGSTSCAPGSSSGGGSSSSSSNAGRAQQGRLDLQTSPWTWSTQAAIQGWPLQAWQMAHQQLQQQQQQLALLPAHEQLLELLGVSRLLLLWIGMVICLDPNQTALRPAVLQQTLLVEVLDVFRACHPQPGAQPPHPAELQQLTLMPCMLLQWASSLQMATDTEDYMFCAVGAAFSSRAALHTWLVQQLTQPAAAAAAASAAAARPQLSAAAGQAVAVTETADAVEQGQEPPEQEQEQAQQQQQQQQQPPLPAVSAATAGAQVDAFCCGDLVLAAVSLLQRLLPVVHSGPVLLPSATLAPRNTAAASSAVGLPRTAVEAFGQTLDLLIFVATNWPGRPHDWCSCTGSINALLEAYVRTSAANPPAIRAQVLLRALRAMYVDDFVSFGPSSYILTRVLLSNSMQAGAGSPEQAHLHSLLVSGLKVSTSLLPDHQSASLELLCSISTAAQAVLCALLDAALVAVEQGDLPAAQAPAAATLPWLVLLGRCSSQLAGLIGVLLGGKLDPAAVAPPGSIEAVAAMAVAARWQGMPVDVLALRLYMTAVGTCAHLLHLLLDWLEPQALLVLPALHNTQAGATGTQRQLNICWPPSGQQGVEQQQQQQQGEQQQQQQAGDAYQQGVDQSAAMTPAAVQEVVFVRCDTGEAQDHHQQQQQQQRQQRRQQQQGAGVQAAEGIVRQMVRDAIAAVGADAGLIVDRLQQTWSAYLASDAALQRHFGPAVLTRLAQVGERMEEPPAPPPPALDTAPVDSNGTATPGSSSSSAAPGAAPDAAPVDSSSGDSSSGSSSSSAAPMSPCVPPEMLAAFAEDAAVVGLVPCLQQAGAALSSLPTSLACNNSACTTLHQDSERVIVSGRGCLCGGCKLARYCGKACHEQHWKTHRPVCKRAGKLLQEAAASAAQDG